MKTYNVTVTQTVEVTLDESKFDAEFLAEFDRTFYDFSGEIERHAAHLGQLYARGIEDEFSTFIEGYGPPKEMGIGFRELSTTVETPNTYSESGT